jgi:multidrug efflux pump subunit AcrA (membrane-fusion protein)
MYDVSNEIDEEKEAVKEDLAVAEAKLASTDTELAEAHEEVSRVRHELQLLQQEVTDLNTRAEQVKTSHIEALKEADERSRNLERTKSDSDRSLKAEINRLSIQLAIRDSSNTPMSAMTRSLPGAGSTNRRGMENDDSSEITPQRGRLDQRTTSGASDTQRYRPSTLVHSIAHEAKYLKGASITRDEVSKFVSFLERYDGNGEYVQGGVSKFINTAATKTITMKLHKT